MIGTGMPHFVSNSIGFVLHVYQCDVETFISICVRIFWVMNRSCKIPHSSHWSKKQKAMETSFYIDCSFPKTFRGKIYFLVLPWKKCFNDGVS